jgi:predicted lipid-binding transport protein (Tim44 family)
MKHRASAVLAGMVIASVLVIQVGDVWARVSSGGSRGSRSFSSPTRPSPTPTTPSSPSRSLSQPSPVSPAPQRPSFFRGMMGAVAGFAIGGLLGSLLFGHGGFGGGIGMLDILLIGGGLLMLFMFLRRRQQAPPEPAYASAYGSGQGSVSPMTGAGGTATMEMPAGPSDLERGVSNIRQMDPNFDPAGFAAGAKLQFANVQSAMAAREIGGVRDRLTPEMLMNLQRQLDELKAARQTNYVGSIDIEQADVTEAWQENGQDYVTVYFNGKLIDYTVDDQTGNVVNGSKTQPQPFEEFWTFARPVGPNPWRLSAIQTAS